MNRPLVRFLASGDLEPIRLGMSPEEVQAALGQPDSVGLRMRVGVILWKLADLQLTFHDKRLGMIGLHFDEGGQLLLPGRIHSASGQFAAPKTIADLLHLCKVERIEFSSFEELTLDDQVAYRIGYNVTFVAERESGRLHSAHARQA